MDCPRVSSFCACGSEFEFTTSSKSKEAVQISESCKQWLPPGFAACDLLRTKCKSHFTRWASQVSQHNPEPTPAETPKITKRRYGDPIDLHVDTTDRESPLEPDARMVLWVLLKRLEHNTEDYKGVAGVKIMEVSSSGGGQPFCMLHCPKRKGHSTRTQQRAAQTVMAAFHAQATDALTVSDMMVAVTKKRECKKNGLQMVSMYAYRNDDLEKFKAFCRLSDYTCRTFISICKHDHGIKFGQSITKMRADRKARRHDIAYTKEYVKQADGKEHLVYVSRAKNLLDVVAHRVSLLINNGKFHDPNAGTAMFEVPGGSVLVSPVVCSCVKKKIKNQNQNQHFFNAHTATTHTHTTQYDNGGKEYKLILQMRNTTTPNSTVWPTIIGSFHAPKHQSGKLDSYENIYNLMLQGALATGMQLSEQLYTLGNAIALEFKHTAEDAEGTVTVTHSIACVPGLTDEQKTADPTASVSVAPFTIAAVFTGLNYENHLAVPGAELKENDDSTTGLLTKQEVENSIGSWVPIETEIPNPKDPKKEQPVRAITHLALLEGTSSWSRELQRRMERDAAVEWTQDFADIVQTAAQMAAAADTAAAALQFERHCNFSATNEAVLD